MPRFWDPFCGGGSLPLEALRLGLEPIATDLNPVAVFTTRVLISLAPKYYDQEPINPKSSKAELVSGRSPYEGLKDDLLYYGEKVGSVLSNELLDLYPGYSRQDTAEQIESSPIAWVWARTVECPNPSCRALAPLVNKFWLSTHKGNEAFVEPVYEGPGVRKFRFEIRKNGQPKEGTVSRAGAICLACSNPISFDHIRSEGVAGRVAYAERWDEKSDTYLGLAIERAVSAVVVIDGDSVIVRPEVAEAHRPAPVQPGSGDATPGTGDGTPVPDCQPNRGFDPLGELKN
jgi:putative DNA methylase